MKALLVSINKTHLLGAVLMIVGAIFNYGSKKLSIKFSKEENVQKNKVIFQLIGLVLVIFGGLLIFNII